MWPVRVAISGRNGLRRDRSRGADLGRDLWRFLCNPDSTDAEHPGKRANKSAGATGPMSGIAHWPAIDRTVRGA